MTGKKNQERKEKTRFESSFLAAGKPPLNNENHFKRMIEDEEFILSVWLRPKVMKVLKKSIPIVCLDLVGIVADRWNYHP
jgi:hypothetical protein